MTVPGNDDGPVTSSTAEPSPRGAGASRGQRRPKAPPRPVRVVSVSRLAPRLVSVLLGGDGLEGFRHGAPTSHMKVFLPAPGQAAPVLPERGPDGAIWPEDAARPVVRTYTPRKLDDEARTLEVQFVLHGAGPASEWAERAQVGDELAVAGPGGRFSLDPAARRWWIGGDESALPAIGTLLDALPPSAVAEVHVEVAGSDDEIPLPSAAQTTLTWHHRRSPDAWGTELEEAARGAALGGDSGTHVWVACEAVVVRRIRKHLLDDRRLPVGSIVTRGYWRLGVADHPDHDYGDD
ncbi:MAG: siderophore-interacting protein [Acidimicrobiales bacterium]